MIWQWDINNDTVTYAHFQMDFAVLLTLVLEISSEWERETSRQIIKIWRFILPYCYVAEVLYRTQTDWIFFSRRQKYCRKAEKRPKSHIKSMILSWIFFRLHVAGVKIQLHRSPWKIRVLLLHRHNTNWTTSIFWLKFMLSKVLPCISCRFKCENMSLSIEQVWLP